jgi:hypothetical protein
VSTGRAGGRCARWAWTRANYCSAAGDGRSDRRRRRPGQEPDRRLPACGKCLLGSEPRKVWMVRRRSTVRFRKGAPQVRRAFRLSILGPLPRQGNGPEFNS